MYLENKDGKYFQYTTTVEKKSWQNWIAAERVSNIETFINKYKWKGINYSSEIED